MSADTITDRPLPFEVKAAFLQFFTLAMATPNEVADISVEFGLFTSVSIRCYPGGYHEKTVPISEEIYWKNYSVEHTLARCAEVMDKLNKALAAGRQIKIQRLKNEAKKLMDQAAAMEAVTISQNA